jgi:hypothetical protein
MDAELIRRRLEDAVLAAMDGWCRREARWGHDDCAMACAQPLADVLGYDPAEKFRGRYRSRRGARRVIGKGGLSRALRQAAKTHGWVSIAPHEAQAGDIGIARYKGQTGTVICRAPGWYVWRAEWPGYVAIPAAMVKRAWKVAPHARLVSYSRSVGGYAGMWPAPQYRVGPDARRVERDPVSIGAGIEAIFGLLTAGGISSSAALALGYAASAALVVGASIGLSYLQAMLIKRPTSEGAPLNDPSIRYNTRQPIPPKRIIYGEQKVGGALFFEEVKPPYLYQGLLLCDEEIDSFRRVFVGGNEIAFGALTPNTILTPIAMPGQPDYPNRLQVSLRIGTANQLMDPLLARDFPRLGRVVVPRDLGTAIGTLTGGGGVAAAFDGSQAQSFAESASLTTTGASSGWVGKDFGVGHEQCITGVKIVAPTDRGLVWKQTGGITSNAATITIQASTDNFVSSIVTVWTEPSAVYGNGAVFERGWQADANLTAYRYWRVLLVDNDADMLADHIINICEVEFYAGQTFLQRGIATAVMRYHFGADQNEFTALWGQVQRPNPLFMVRGIKMGDPRKSGHIVSYDPTDDAAVAAAKATWEWSDNATLVQAHYLTQRYGGRIDPRNMRWDKIAEAAEWDDGLIGTLSGQLIRRHTANGVISLDQSSLIAGLLSANRGQVLRSGGKVWLSSSAPRDPVATIYDDILAGPVEVQFARPKKDLINRLTTRFVDKDQDYQLVDGPPLVRQDLEDEDGELLQASLELPMTDDYRRAERLAKAYLAENRRGKRISAHADMRLLGRVNDDELVGNAVRFESMLFPQASGIYRVESWGFRQPDFAAIELSLAEYDKTIETDWDAAVDEQPFTVAALDVS